MKMIRLNPKNPDSLCNLSAALAFVLALATYWVTADSGVSYWDCPEYVVTASLLEVGHPPGNPVWTLAMRFLTIPFPQILHARVINLASGLFMALATLFLAKIIFAASQWCLTSISGKFHHLSASRKNIVSSVAALGGALCFAFCDSAWFSAVEAEVYAMSTFMSALSIWLIILWTKTGDSGKKFRLIILISYIMGLSLGVHQLNLLCIPVLALIGISGSRREKNATLYAILATILSFAAVGFILAGLMQGPLSWLEIFEIEAVNHLHLPLFSGAISYCVALLLSFIATVILLRKGILPAAIPALIFLWMSGIFCLGGDIFIGGLLSLTAILAMILIPRLRGTAILAGFWSIAFLLLGYSSFALILIRSCAYPPMNEAVPDNVFALQRYISRSQYGSKPLVYGATPFSRPLIAEEIDSNGLASYRKYILKKRDPLFIPLSGNPRLNHRSGFINDEDSAANRNTIEQGNGYIKADYLFSRVTTPELDMWFPRITSQSPGMMDSYNSWAGMCRENMDSVAISETIGPDGSPVPKISATTGEREHKTGLRPTYLQNLRMFLTYQAGYMYFRYLLWNFMGRQNDVNSTGEIDHGNFITGIPPLDNLMVGDQDLLPRDIGLGNPGRNVYYGIPFLTGIVGIIWLARGNGRRRRTLAAVTLLFLMTGLAIVVYLNQDPGEPRERDYSFLGSFMAFAIWIAFGFTAAALPASGIRNRYLRIPATLFLPLLCVGLLWSRNFDDHDRRSRGETSRFASNILASVPDAYIFSKGDNFTFPLWYAQEVEKKGLNHTVIDISYLSTPEYVANLMKLGKRGASFVAGHSDIAYGAYAFTRIAPDADPTPVPLRDVLQELYSQRSGYPVLRHSRAFLSREGCDTIFINLREMASGGNIPFRKLMLLDIAAANHELKQPRALYFLSSTDSDFSRIFAPHSFPGAFGDVFVPWLDSIGRHEIDQSLLCHIIGKGDNASPGNAYLDPVILDQYRRQRGGILRIASKRLDRGDIHGARVAIDRIDSLFPYGRIPAGSYTVADSTFAEGLEYASLLLKIGKISNDPISIGKAGKLLEEMKSRSRSLLRYRQSLPEWRRDALSNDARRSIFWLPAIDSLLRSITPTPDSIHPHLRKY